MNLINKTSIIMISNNDFHNLKPCIDSIRMNTPKHMYQLIVVDNHSEDGSIDWLMEQSDVLTVFNNELLNVAAAYNQALQFAKENVIVFVHSDVIATAGWLEKLIDGLEHEGVAAVGPLSNNAQDQQMVDAEFKTLDQLNIFVEGLITNGSTSLTLSLDGFCFAIKRDVLLAVGGLDERFETEGFVLSDLQLRIVESGNMMFILNDSFVYHYGESSTDFKKDAIETVGDQATWEEKWSEQLNYHNPLTEYITASQDESIRILLVNCGFGETYVHLRNYFKRAVLCGIESEMKLARISNRLAEVRPTLQNWKSEQFDVIIVDEKLHRLEDPALYIESLRDMLTEDGQLIVSFNNYYSFTHIRDWLSGNDILSSRCMMKHEDVSLYFEQANYAQLDVHYVDEILNEQEEFLLEELSQRASDRIREQMVTKKYIFVAKRTEDEEVVHGLISNLTFTHDIALVEKLRRYSPEMVIKVIQTSFQEEQFLLIQYLASTNYEKKKFKHVVPYLEYAYSLNSKESSTLLQMSMVFHALGELKKSMSWVRRIQEPSWEAKEWMDKLRAEIRSIDYETNKLKFLLRRIEHDVEVEEASRQLVVLLQEHMVDNEKIIDSVNQYMIHKDEVLNRIAAICFENELYDNIIPLLQHAIELNPSNHDTFYNIGYILFQMKQFEDALYFLRQITTPDVDTNELIQQIERASIHG